MVWWSNCSLIDPVPLTSVHSTPTHRHHNYWIDTTIITITIPHLLPGQVDHSDICPLHITIFIITITIVTKIITITLPPPAPWSSRSLWHLPTPTSWSSPPAWLASHLGNNPLSGVQQRHLQRQRHRQRQQHRQQQWQRKRKRQRPDMYTQFQKPMYIHFIFIQIFFKT